MRNNLLNLSENKHTLGVLSHERPFDANYKSPNQIANEMSDRLISLVRKNLTDTVNEIKKKEKSKSKK